MGIVSWCIAEERNELFKRYMVESEMAYSVLMQLRDHFEFDILSGNVGIMF